MSVAVRKDVTPARQRKLVLNACYDRGFHDESARRPQAAETELRAKGGEEAVRRYRAGRRVARRELERDRLAAQEQRTGSHPNERRSR